jgi:putative DNA primase/helicase
VTAILSERQIETLKDEIAKLRASHPSWADVTVVAELGPRFGESRVQEAMNRISGNGGNGDYAKAIGSPETVTEPSPPRAAPAEVTVEDIHALVQEGEERLVELEDECPAPPIDQLSDSRPNLSDLGNAERMCKRYGSKLHFVSKTSQWLVWNGRVWSPDSDALLNKYAKRVIRAIYTEAADEKDSRDKERLLRHAMISEADGRIAAMLSRLRWEDNRLLGIDIPIEHSLLDADPAALNLVNGTLDLRTGDLRKHRKEDLLTRIASVEYHADATSDLWESFLDTVTDGDMDLRLYLQRAAGYSLLANNESEKFFYVLGDTASGKSTFVSAVLSVLGDYGASADIQSFLQQKNQSRAPRDDLAALAGARLIAVGETEKGAKLHTALVKLMAGGDPIKVRHLFGRYFTFRPGVIWLHANNRAKVPQDEKALFRRLRVIPFKHSIPEEKQDPQIKRDLCNPKLHGAAILAWLVQGCLAYQRDGLGDSQAAREANAEYKRSMNPVDEWARERCKVDPGNATYWESTKDLYDDYRRYCSENHVADRFTLSNISLGKALGAMDLEPKSQGRSNARGWAGIRLMSVENDSSQSAFQSSENDSSRDLEPGPEDEETAEGQANEQDIPF